MILPWLTIQYNVDSNLSWMRLMDYIYDSKVNENINKVSFLFDNLDGYLIDTQ